MPSVLISLDGKPHQVISDLDERELYAIGFVTVAWAILEHLLLAATAKVAHEAALPLPEDATSLAFKRRLRAFRALVRKAVTDEDNRNRLLGIATRISNCKRGRHQLTHGVWDWDARSPDELIAMSLRPRTEFVERFDFEKMVKLGERIGAVNFDLMYPGGKDQAYREHFEATQERGGYVGRSSLRSVAAKDQQRPRRRRSKPPAHK